ncbi:MAG TPA: hypothetical protein VEX35_02075 [Allosphingosinicella sp.]|nr:hypothetical protein [Allosphingosinicella sp.]
MTAYQVTTSAELMENYLQADILDPQDKFVALQTDAGASLLFSIATDGSFYLTKELQGEAHGWTRDNLAAAQIGKDFPGGATCKTFAAAQAPAQAGQAAAVQLAMVLNDGTNDHLYLSLGNSDSDTSWSEQPVWVACPYNAKDGNDDPIPAPAPFRIAGVMVSEASDAQYVVVDIVRNAAGMLWRFYIDVTTPSGPVWMPHDIAVDIDAASYVSCLGRKANGSVDGLYTMGTVTNLAQLIYTPLYNAFNPKLPAAPSRLLLAGGATAEVIAACRNPDNSSDLYAVAQGGLYYFASTNQHDEATAPLLVSDPLLSGARALFAYAADGQVIVWGLSGSDEVFYLSCAQSQAASGPWTAPIAILAGVDAISPYVDRQYSANTFFAHGADGLIKAVKTPDTGLWHRQSITLAPSDKMQDPAPISSYTTHIQVNGSDGQGVPNVALTLTATALTPVYINHLYYVVGPDPIDVATDLLGTVTIVQAVHTLSAARFTVVVDGTPMPAINPMDAPFKRSAQLNSVASLQNAVITNRDGSTRPFIPAGTSQDDLEKVALSNRDLSTAYGKVSSAPPPARALRRAGPRPVPGALVAAGFGDGIETDLGDLFSWLESGIEAAVSIVEDAAGDVWHFVASIAGKIYYGVLDCVEKIVGAAMWLYNAIKVIIEDIILFLEFLFAWKDILTTHSVLKNILVQTTQYALDQLSASKADISSAFAQIESQIGTWAGLTGFGQTPAGTAAANPPRAGQASAPGNLGLHHFQGNCSNGQSGYSPPDPAEAIFQDLVNLVSTEEATLTGAFDAIRTQIIDQFSNLSMTEIIERFVGILAETLLETAENILLALVDVLIQLADGMMDLLSASIDIPVLSWLYKELTGDDLSFIDLICLIVAIPATLIYKATADAAPFPRGDAFTDGLINAASFAEVKAQFLQGQPLAKAASRGARLRSVGPAADPPLDQAKLKVFGIVTGVAALGGSAVLVIVSGIQKTLDFIGIDVAFPKMLASLNCVGNIAYVSPNIATFINLESGAWYNQLNNALTGVSILKGIAAIPLAASKSPWVKWTFPAVETGINIAWNVPVIANIVVNKDVYNTTYKSLIPESIGNFAFNLGGMMELPIALVKDPVTKLEMAAVQAGLMLTYGVSMVVAGAIYEWTPDQSH